MISENKANWTEVDSFRSKRTVGQFKSDFIDRIIWAYAQPHSVSLQADLREQIAAITHEEFGVAKIEGRGHADHVLQHVRNLSVEPDREKRQVTKSDLRELLQNHSVVLVLPNDLALLRQDSEKLKTLPIQELDQIIFQRTSWLTKARFFRESEAENYARQLSTDVSDGGQFAVCSRQVRADALLLCARVLLINANEKSKKLLERARQLDCSSDNFLCVEALVAGQTDQQIGLAMLFGKHGTEFNAFRFAIHNLAAPMGALKWLRASQFPSKTQNIVINISFTPRLHPSNNPARMASKAASVRSLMPSFSKIWLT